MRTRSQQGFTLIEILLVVVIVVLIIGIARLSLPGSSQFRLLEKEARLLFGRIELANEEVVLRNRLIGLRFFTDHGAKEPRLAYQWLIREQQRWELWESEAVFTEHRFPLAVEVEVESEGVLQAPAKSRDEIELKPTLVFSGNGQPTTFALGIFLQDDIDRGFVISGDYQGRVEMQRVGDEQE
jgi:general secretion pathway protein H